MKSKNFLVIMLILLIVSVGQLSGVQQGNPADTAPQQMIIGLVDVSAVIAFHPVMRNFDYHAQKFVRPWNGQRYPTAQEAWDGNKELIIKIKSVEAKILKQIQAVNLALNEYSKQKIKLAEKESALEELKKLNKSKVEMLATLTRSTIGVFPENDFFEADEQTGNYVMGEIRRAVYEVALRNQAAFVFNTSQLAISGSESVAMQQPGKEDPVSILQRFGIANLEDLRRLLFETGKNEQSPYGKAPGKMDFRKGPSGEHFDQIKDPAHVQVLMDEYYQNRDIFSNALKKYGSGSFLLHGGASVLEKNITREVIQYIFDLHKTKAIVTESAFKALK
ncbi:MAG: hypothetical protein KKB51_15160 [Candidatus Riflebacteria bacterium]|nr:hypothetical protein [Candidatus Riflebacteria bacterium]